MKRKFFSAVGAIGFTVIVLHSCTDKKGLLPNPPTPGIVQPPLVRCDTISYLKHVKPFIVSDCADCHHPGAGKGAPAYDYNTWQGLIDAGAVKLKARAITIHDMPKLSPNPDGLTPMKKAILECWIDGGMLNN